MLLTALMYSLILACGLLRPSRFQLLQASDASLVVIKLNSPCMPFHVVSVVLAKSPD